MSNWNKVKGLVLPVSDTVSNWESCNPIIPNGLTIEVIDTDGTIKHKRGNGTARYNDLDYIQESESTKTYEKFVVIGVYGQSNAVGYDESPLTVFDVPKYKNRLFQIGHDNQQIVPLTWCALSAQNMFNEVPVGAKPNGMPAREVAGTKGMHLPLANLVADAIPDDYGVLFVSAAYGGRTLAQLSKNSSYYNRYISNLKKALNSHQDNRLLALIWMQGEFDASQNVSADTYRTGFQQLITDIQNDLDDVKNKTINGNNIDASLWYAVEFPTYFKNVNNNRGREILAVQKEIVGDSNYIAIPDNCPTNTTKYTSGNPPAHYGYDSFRKIIAPRIFNKMMQNGVFATNSYDANTPTVYETAELESEIELLREKNVIMQATITNLLNKVNELAEKVGAETLPEEIEKKWRVATDIDFAWLHEDHGGSVYNNGSFICSHPELSSGIIFNKDIEQIRFRVDSDSALPAFVVVTFDENSGAHNAIFACGTTYQSNGHFWKADSANVAFSGVPRDAQFAVAEMLETAVKGSLITLTKLSDMSFSVQIDDGDPAILDVTSRSNDVLPVRFGFNNFWSRTSNYHVKDIEVFAF